MVRGISHGHVPVPPPKPGKGRGEGEGAKVGRQPAGKGAQIGRGPQLDAHAIAVAMSIAAKEAKKKELSFQEIIQKVIEETGITNPQSAMEEANRKLQKLIEDEITAIKSNKELMEEAQAWEEFGKLLESELSEEQINEFVSLIKKEIN
ncbi:hypothetical protein ACFL52_03420 [Candidatus Margulisiibacteriota bacterium]